MPQKPPQKRDLTAVGLPANLDAERFVLGSILLSGANCPVVAQLIEPSDFSLEKHRRIFARMVDIQLRDEVIDRVTVANELARRGELETCDGLSYLVSLDEGLPETYNLESYVNIIREKSKLRQIIFAGQNAMNAALLKDAVSEDILISSQQSFLTISGISDDQGQIAAEFIDGYKGGINAFLDPSKEEQGIKTGFSKIDEWSDGFHPSEIFLIGARPGVGKSSFGLNISKYVSSKYGLVAFFSMEMPTKVCIDRLVCEEAEVSFQRFRSGTLPEADRKQLQPALSIVSKLPIFFDDRPRLTIPEISIALQVLSNTQKVVLCVIDYVQLLRTPKGQRYSNLNEKFEQITEDIQGMAKRNKIPLLLLSQLNRESTKSKDARPALSQVRNSGTFEQIANFGACIDRPEMRQPNREDLRGLATLIAEKNRSGPCGDIELRYRPSIMRFEDPSE